MIARSAGSRRCRAPSSRSIQGVYSAAIRAAAAGVAATCTRRRSVVSGSRRTKPARSSRWTTPVTAPVVRPVREANWLGVRDPWRASRARNRESVSPRPNRWATTGVWAQILVRSSAIVCRIRSCSSGLGTRREHLITRLQYCLVGRLPTVDPTSQPASARHRCVGPSSCRSCLLTSLRPTEFGTPTPPAPRRARVPVVRPCLLLMSTAPR